MKEEKVEVEIRILLKNRTIVEEELKKRGARIVYFSNMRDYWFCPKGAANHKDVSIDKTGFALRIRESQDMYSGKKIVSLDCKTLCDGENHALCNEYEIGLQDADKAKKILEAIGLKQFLLVDKERIIYEFKNIKFCFDSINEVGDGLEMEIMTEENNAKKAHSELVELAKSFGIKENEILEKSLTYIAMEKLSKF